ncbi:MAG TPA: HAMP domain-containing histidine kinase [Papillibacter sp.]|nr:HAMP domain-containing histidine kinase [Papillibacter sp.]
MAITSRAKPRRIGFLTSIKTKFTLMYFSVIAIVLVLMNTYFLTASRDVIFASKQSFIQSQSGTIAANLSDVFTTLTYEGVGQIISRLDLKGVTHVTVTGADAEPIYDVAIGSESPDSGYSPAEAHLALQGNSIFISRFSEGSFSSSAYTPVTGKDTGLIGVVYVHEYDSEQGQILIGLQSTIKSISFVILFLSIVMVVFMIWTIVNRITSVLKAIESVREGEYNYRITIRGKDELALLGDEFNSLTSRLHETEEIRRRFVADASHELKTPLASIRLLTDSILQNEHMDMPTVREFIADIGSEAERLSRITAKLMTLTRLDSKLSKEHSSVDMRHVVNQSLRMLRPLAKSNSVTLHADLQTGCVVDALEDDLHHVVFNLVENAIKYNRPGGDVFIRLTCSDGFIDLIVEDTGIGVPEDDLPFIFDRFYRVDKARSRVSGGSGLGLSIVRETVFEYGGSIEAKPRRGGGMHFRVCFPSSARDTISIPPASLPTDSQAGDAPADNTP